MSERKRERKRQEENNFIWDMMACVSQASRLLITGTFFDWLLRCQLSQFIMVCWGEEKTNSCHLSLGRNHAGKHWIIVNSPSPVWDSTDPNTSTLHWLHYFKKWNAFQRGKKSSGKRSLGTTVQFWMETELFLKMVDDKCEEMRNHYLLLNTVFEKNSLVILLGIRQTVLWKKMKF